MPMSNSPSGSHSSTRVTSLDVAHCKAAFRVLREHLKRKRVAKSQVDRKCGWLRFGIFLDRVTIRTRSTLDLSVTRWGGIVLLFVILVGITLVVGREFSWSVRQEIIWGTLAAFPAAWITKRILVPTDDALTIRHREFKHRLDVAMRDQEIARESVRAAQWEYELAKVDLARLEARFQSGINRLRMASWKGMRGVEFENFLAAIFREWGYTVRTTPVTGDQGVDLVIERNGRSIAIQAKGYPNSTVGNSAVQEAHTGKAFYRCHAAAVVTNSTFTSSARELASKVGCILIGQEQISDLIEGKIKI